MQQSALTRTPPGLSASNARWKRRAFSSMVRMWCRESDAPKASHGSKGSWNERSAGRARSPKRATRARPRSIISGSTSSITTEPTSSCSSTASESPPVPAPRSTTVSGCTDAMASEATASMRSYPGIHRRIVSSYAPISRRRWLRTEWDMGGVYRPVRSDARGRRARRRSAEPGGLAWAERMREAQPPRSNRRHFEFPRS